MKKYFWIALFGLFWLLAVESQAQTLRWTSFEHLTDSLRKERRPMLVFIHTDWCTYCKMMEVRTFANQQVVTKLQESFYCVRLNAEESQPITFLQRTYKFKATGVKTGVHELAEVLGTENGKLRYPTTVFFDQYLQLQGRMVGAIDVKQLERAIDILLENSAEVGNK
jgi:thioredoxin-related protein